MAVSELKNIREQIGTAKGHVDDPTDPVNTLEPLLKRQAELERQIAQLQAKTQNATPSQAPKAPPWPQRGPTPTFDRLFDGIRALSSGPAVPAADLAKALKSQAVGPNITLIEGESTNAGPGLNFRREGAEHVRKAHEKHAEFMDGFKVLHGNLKDFATKPKDDGFMPAAFRPIDQSAPALSGGMRDLIDAVSTGTKSGFLAAFRELEQEPDLGKDDQAGGGGNGIIKAAFHPAGGSATPYTSGGGMRTFGVANLSGGDAQGEHANYIRQLAAKYGIDPRVAVAVAKSEGLGHFVGDKGTSYGDFQLHYGGSGIPGMNSAGLGDEFTKETGLDARDPKNWKQANEFALKYASQHGWGPWHGAARIGVRGMAGIGGRSVESEAPQMKDILGSAGNGRAADVAESLIGASGAQAQAVLHARMTFGQWCADFMNGAIRAAGGKGTNSSAASSFAQWGQEVGKDVIKRGDILLENHHVGMATGEIDPKTGRIGMVSGNYGHKVSHSWESPEEILQVRRAMQDAHERFLGTVDRMHQNAPQIPPPSPHIERAAAAMTGAANRMAATDPIDGEIRVHLHEGRVKKVVAKASGPAKFAIKTGPTFTEA